MFFIQSSEDVSSSKNQVPFLIFELQGKEEETVTIIYSCEKGSKYQGLEEWAKSSCSIIENHTVIGDHQLWICTPEDTSIKIKETLTPPVMPLTDNAGFLRVISGDYQGTLGPFQTSTPIIVYDVRMPAGNTTSFTLTGNQAVRIFVLSGELLLPDNEIIHEAELGFFQTNGDTIAVSTKNDCKFLIVAGNSINEPYIGFGKLNIS